MNEEIMLKIQEWQKVADTSSDNAAMGFDEGFYTGKADAFQEVLDLKTDDYLTDVENLMNEASTNSDNAAAGFDEGYYNGREEAFDEVLKLMKVEV